MHFPIHLQDIFDMKLSKKIMKVVLQSGLSPRCRNVIWINDTKIYSLSDAVSQTCSIYKSWIYEVPFMEKFRLYKVIQPDNISSLKVLYGLILLHHIRKSVFWNVGRQIYFVKFGQVFYLWTNKVLLHHSDQSSTRFWRAVGGRASASALNACFSN